MLILIDMWLNNFFSPKIKKYTITVYLFRRGVTRPETSDFTIECASMSTAIGAAIDYHCKLETDYHFNVIDGGIEIIERD